MNPLPKIIVCILIVILCISCDQATKTMANNTLAHYRPISFINNLFILQLARNNGAFLGIGGEWPYVYRLIFLVLLPIIGIFALSLVLLKSTKFDLISVIAFALILGGGVSNLSDRLLNKGWVIDFMNLGIGNIRTGIFNFADVFILLGLGMLLLVSVRKHYLK